MNNQRKTKNNQDKPRTIQHLSPRAPSGHKSLSYQNGGHWGDAQAEGARPHLGVVLCPRDHSPHRGAHPVDELDHAVPGLRRARAAGFELLWARGLQETLRAVLGLNASLLFVEIERWRCRLRVFWAV